VTRPAPLTAESLLASARRERPAPELKAATLRRMLEVTPAPPARGRALPLLVPVLLAAAAVLGLWWVNSPSPEADSIRPERLAESAHAVPSSRASAAVSANPPPAPASAPPPPPRRAASPPPPPPTLSQELAALERAQAALDAEEPRRALALLEAYEHSGGRRLWAEAEVLRIEALSRAGEREAASRQAEEFVASHPGNPLIDRARAFVGSNPE
jgi:hypothetical protein